MLKNKIILAVIAVIIALGLAGCRAEKRVNIRQGTPIR